MVVANGAIWKLKGLQVVAHGAVITAVKLSGDSAAHTMPLAVSLVEMLGVVPG
jgi:hypothetical protein